MKGRNLFEDFYFFAHLPRSLFNAISWAWVGDDGDLLEEFIRFVPLGKGEEAIPTD